MKFAKNTPHYPPHLWHVATLPWEIKNSNFLQIFSRYGKMQTNCIIIFIASITLLFIHKFCGEFFTILIANKSFCVTVFFFLAYFCDQSVAPEICHSRRHCSVCQQSTWHSATRTRLWQKHINTLSIHSYARRGIKIGALKMQFVCTFPYLLNICIKFEFLVSQGSVATCLRWGDIVASCMAFVSNFMRFPSMQKF